MNEEPVIREIPEDQQEQQEEKPCSHCHRSAVVKIRKDRGKKREELLCRVHYHQWKRIKHFYGYSVEFLQAKETIEF